MGPSTTTNTDTDNTNTASTNTNIPSSTNNNNSTNTINTTLFQDIAVKIVQDELEITDFLNNEKIVHVLRVGVN